MLTSRVRQFVPQETGSGDNNRLLRRCNGSTSLIQEMGGSAGVIFSGQYPFVQRLIIATVLLIVVLLISTWITCMHFMFDVAKPVYFVYIGGIAVVEFLAPALVKLDALLDTSVTYTSTVEQGLRDNEPETDATQEAVMLAGNLQNATTSAAGRTLIPCCQQLPFPPVVNPGENNNLDEHEFHDSIAGVSEEVAVPQWSSACVATNLVKAKNRSWIPAPLTKGRKVKSRGRTTGQGETNAQLLRALESELRKDIKLTKVISDKWNKMSKKSKPQ